jgi:excisionase family DNA binding protein
MVGDYLTTEEFARLHNVPVETVRTRIKKGQLVTIKAGRSHLIKIDTPWEDSRMYNCGRYKKGSSGNAVKSEVEKKSPS